MKKVKAQLGSRTKRASKQKIAEIIGQLFLVGDHLPSKLRRQILDLGPAAVPFLVEMLFDPNAAQEHIPGPGLFPLHAVTLLGDLRATEAVEPLETFRESAFPDGPVGLAILEALAKIEAAPAPQIELPPPADDEEDPRARLLAFARSLAGA
jgi:hypothetical protein